MAGKMHALFFCPLGPTHCQNGSTATWTLTRKTDREGAQKLDNCPLEWKVAPLRNKKKTPTSLTMAVDHEVYIDCFYDSEGPILTNKYLHHPITLMSGTNLHRPLVRHTGLAGGGRDVYCIDDGILLEWHLKQLTHDYFHDYVGGQYTDHILVHDIQYPWTFDTMRLYFYGDGNPWGEFDDIKWTRFVNEMWENITPIVRKLIIRCPGTLDLSFRKPIITDGRWAECIRVAYPFVSEVSFGSVMNDMPETMRSIGGLNGLTKLKLVCNPEDFSDAYTSSDLAGNLTGNLSRDTCRQATGPASIGISLLFFREHMIPLLLQHSGTLTKVHLKLLVLRDVHKQDQYFGAMAKAVFDHSPLCLHRWMLREDDFPSALLPGLRDPGNLVGEYMTGHDWIETRHRRPQGPQDVRALWRIVRAQDNMAFRTYFILSGVLTDYLATPDGCLDKNNRAGFREAVVALRTRVEPLVQPGRPLDELNVLYCLISYNPSNIAGARHGG